MSTECPGLGWGALQTQPYLSGRKTHEVNISSPSRQMKRLELNELQRSVRVTHHKGQKQDVSVAPTPLLLFSVSLWEWKGFEGLCLAVQLRPQRGPVLHFVFFTSRSPGFTKLSGRGFFFSFLFFLSFFLSSFLSLFLSFSLSTYF